MSGITQLIHRFVHIVASAFWPNGRLVLDGNMPLAKTDEGLFSCIVYKKL